MQKKHNAVYDAVDGFFRLTERGTNIKTEVFAGLLMFVEVVCMTAVCSQMITAQAGIPKYSTVYFGIMLMTVASTVLTGLICNAPVMQSVSMGSVVLIVSTMANNLGMTLSNVLLIAMVSNAIYLVAMVIPPVRRFVSEAVPEQIKKALPAALGAYLLVYALSQLNLFGMTTYNYNAVLEGMAAAGDALPYWGANVLNFGAENAAFGGWYAQAAIITAVVAFLSMTVFHARGFKHATIISFGVTVLVYVAMWLLRGNFMDYYLYAFITPSYGGMYFYDGIQRIFGEFNATILLKPFAEGTDFTKYVNYLTYLEAQALGVSMDQVTVDATGKIIALVGTTALSFLVLGVSETAASVKACAYASGAQDDGTITANPNLGGAGKILDVYSINALCSTVGCALGIGPMTVRPECVVGAREGGKTGLAAIVAGLLAIISVFNVALAGIFLDGIVVMGMLIFVAVTLLGSIRSCDFSTNAASVPFLATVAAAAVTQNLGSAVLAGIALDTLVKLLDGRAKEVKIGSVILTLVFAILLTIQFV